MTDAATMRKISFWRYLAVNPKTLFTALACALLAFSMLGCGASDHLQSITLTPASGSGGLFNLVGIGGTLQLVATANYSNGKLVVLHGEGLTYQISADPVNDLNAFGGALLPPQSNTVTLSPTGLLTAIEPAECTWIDVAGIIPPATSAPTPSWALSGDYVVTATYQGITSQPVFIGIASAVGNPSNPNLGSEGDNNNPNELCGPGQSAP
jgi:hypothetical protein